MKPIMEIRSTQCHPSVLTPRSSSSVSSRMRKHWASSFFHSEARPHIPGVGELSFRDIHSTALIIVCFMAFLPAQLSYTLYADGCIKFHKIVYGYRILYKFCSGWR